MRTLCFPGAPVSAATADEIDAVADAVITSQAATVGLDLEWNFERGSKIGGPVAVIQLCWPAIGGELQAAVLHVARVPAGRMTGRLRTLLEDGSVRKVVFGNCDEPRLDETYGERCRVASLVDAQACLQTHLPALLPKGLLYPTLANVVAWLLGWHISKGLQKRSNWEVQSLSDKEIEYGATDAYAHLMVWRRMLQLTAIRAAAADVEAPPAEEEPCPLAGGKHKRKWAGDEAGSSSQAWPYSQQQQQQQAGDGHSWQLRQLQLKLWSCKTAAKQLQLRSLSTSTWRQALPHRRRSSCC